MIATRPDELITIPEVAEATARPAEALRAEALRRPDEIPVFVQPDPPGWRAVRLQADPRHRVPVFQEMYPDGTYDLVLTEPIRLTPDVLREVLAAGILFRATIDGETISTVREESGYSAWSIDAEGVVEIDPDNTVSRQYKESYRLCEAQPIPLDSLLVLRSAVDLLRLGVPPGASAVEPAAPDAGADRPSPALLTVAEGARRLRMRRTRAEAWLEARRLIQHFGGRKRISATKLDAAIAAEGSEPAAPEQKPPTPAKPRKSRRPPKPPVVLLPVGS